MAFFLPSFTNFDHTLSPSRISDLSIRLSEERENGKNLHLNHPRRPPPISDWGEIGSETINRTEITYGFKKDKVVSVRTEREGARILEALNFRLL